jgi:hypothetical protein
MVPPPPAGKGPPVATAALDLAALTDVEVVENDDLLFVVDLEVDVAFALVVVVGGGGGFDVDDGFACA